MKRLLCLCSRISVIIIPHTAMNPYHIIECMSVYNYMMQHNMYIKAGHLHMQLNNDLDDMRSELAVQTRWGRKSENVGLLHLHMQHYMSRQPTSTSPPQTHHASYTTTNTHAHPRHPLTHAHNSMPTLALLPVCSPLELWSTCWRSLNHGKYPLDKTA